MNGPKGIEKRDPSLSRYLVSTFISGVGLALLSLSFKLGSPALVFLGSLFAVIGVRLYTLLVEAVTANKGGAIPFALVLLKIALIMSVIMSIDTATSYSGALSLIVGIMAFVPGALMLVSFRR